MMIQGEGKGWFQKQAVNSNLRDVFFLKVRNRIQYYSELSSKMQWCSRPKGCAEIQNFAELFPKT